MGLHQWKKYRINYQKIWEANFSDKSKSYKDFVIESSRAKFYSESMIYTRFEINKNDGRFILTNPKKAEDAKSGDTMYCGFDYSYGDDYDKTYYYKTDEPYEGFHVIYEFHIEDEGNFSSHDSGYEEYYFYKWYRYEASLIGCYDSILKQTIPKQGSYIGLVQGQDKAYPQNGQKDGFWYVYDKKLNDPPTKPDTIFRPTKMFSKIAETISWFGSTDPESDPISYKLERSLDGKEFVQIYKGPLTYYKDTIEEEGHTSVVYRVTAIDSYGNQSPSLTSASIPVSDNTPPIIDTDRTELGKIDSPPTVKFTVKDPDQGQTGQASVYLNDKKIDSFGFKASASRSVKINDNDWLRLLNGKHTIRISAEDSENASSSKAIIFEKAITKIDFELIKPLEADAMVTKATINLVGSIPKDAIIKVEACNNGYDKNPTWEDVTIKAIKERKIFFANKQKTADKWGVNVRVSMERNGATEECYISSIGGSYE